MCNKESPAINKRPGYIVIKVELRSRENTPRRSYLGQSTSSRICDRGQEIPSRSLPRRSIIRCASRGLLSSRLHSRRLLARPTFSRAHESIEISGGFLLLRTCRGAPIRRSCRREENLGLALRSDLCRRNLN